MYSKSIYVYIYSGIPLNWGGENKGKLGVEKRDFNWELLTRLPTTYCTWFTNKNYVHTYILSATYTISLLLLYIGKKEKKCCLKD